MAADLEADGVPAPSIEWRRILKEIDEDLDSAEVKAMCFLCRDNLAGSRLEKISRGLELLAELESKGLISPLNSRFLSELLYRAGRMDLLRKLNHTFRTVQAVMDKSGSCFSPFRLLLQYFCDEMNDDEVQSMRFLAGSYIAKNKLQDVKMAQELFVILEKAQIVVPEDVMVLKDMTASLDRSDLFDKILEYEALRSGIPLPMPGSMLPPGMIPVMHPGGGVGVPLPAKGAPPAGPPGFFPGYAPGLQGDKMSPPAPPSLSTITPMTSYNDPPPPYTPPLTPKREPIRMQGKQQPLAVQDISLDRALTPPIDSGPNKAQLANQLQQEMENMTRMRQLQRLQEIQLSPARSVPKPEKDLKEIKKGGEELKKEFQKERSEGKRSREEKSKDEQKERVSEIDDMPCYKMDAKPRGICVIINNREFYQVMGDPKSKFLPMREGTEIDCQNLHYVFQKLSFHVEVFHNLSDTEIIRTLSHYAGKVDHSKFDCFTCCILTHGMTGGIYGVNGRFVEIKELTSCFKAVRCPSLAGKPKLFFLQACQGRAKQHGHDVTSLETDGPDDLPPESIPNEADFLFGYATIPGFVSYRSRSMGSWYITKLVEMLDKYAHKYDLLSILIKVNEEVGKAVAQVENQMYKQTPAPMPTLRKKIYFN